MFTNLLNRLFSSKQQPLPLGTPVNQVRNGHVLRSDGTVIGTTAQGVLVEWRNGGSSCLDTTELSVIQA